jgi:hypothetical protein
MRLFKRRARPSREETKAERVVELEEEAAEERQEYTDETEVAGSRRRGLNPRWGLSKDDDEVARREARAAADPESDTAEELFIQSEKEAEERGRYDFPR